MKTFKKNNKRSISKTNIVLRMTSLVIFWMAILLSSLALYGLRSFYYLSDDKCVTLWKRSDGAYIILEKYKSIRTPTNNYIKTENSNFTMTIIWTNDNRILIDESENVEIVQPISYNNLPLELYKDNKSENDRLFTYFDGKYKVFDVKTVDILSLYIKENYAVDKTGKKIK